MDKQLNLLHKCKYLNPQIWKQISFFISLTLKSTIFFIPGIFNIQFYIVPLNAFAILTNLIIDKKNAQEKHFILRQLNRSKRSSFRTENQVHVIEEWLTFAKNKCECRIYISYYRPMLYIFSVWFQSVHGYAD